MQYWRVDISRTEPRWALDSNGGLTQLALAQLLREGFDKDVVLILEWWAE